MRKGKWSTIRQSNKQREYSTTKRERKRRNKRYAEYAANEREAQRKPRVKRNGVEIS